MGELVLEVVERIIGRESRRRRPPGPHRRGGLGALNAERRAGPRPPEPGPGREPDPPGLRRRHLRRRRAADASRRRPPTSRRCTTRWPTTAALHAPLTDTAIAAPGPPGRGRGPAGRPGRPSPAGWPPMPRPAVSGPEVPTAIDWLALRARRWPTASVVERALGHAGARRGSAATPPPSSRSWPPTASRRSKTSCSASPGPSSRAGAALALTDPELPVDAAGGSSTTSSGPRSSPGPSAWSTSPSPAADPGTWWAPWTGWSSRRRRPGAGGWPGCGRPPRSTTPSRRELGQSLAALAGSPVELQVDGGPVAARRGGGRDRRPAGRRHGSGPARRVAGAPRARRLGENPAASGDRPNGTYDTEGAQ